MALLLFVRKSPTSTAGEGLSTSQLSDKKKNEDFIAKFKLRGRPIGIFAYLSFFRLIAQANRSSKNGNIRSLTTLDKAAAFLVHFISGENELLELSVESKKEWDTKKRAVTLPKSFEWKKLPFCKTTRMLIWVYMVKQKRDIRRLKDLAWLDKTKTTIYFLGQLSSETHVFWQLGEWHVKIPLMFICTAWAANWQS